MFKFRALILFAVACLFSFQVQAGKLNNARSAARGSGSSSSSSRSSSGGHHSSSHHHSSGHHHHGHSDADDWLAFLILSSPFLAPHLVMEPKEGSIGYFPAFPYAGDADGSMVVTQAAQTDPDNVESPIVASKPVGASHFTLRLGAEYAFDLSTINEDYKVHRPNLSLQFDSSTRFGVETRWRYMFELADDGTKNAFWLGDANLTVRFAQSKRTQFRVGFGPKFLIDGADSRFGFTILAYSLDIFPVKPLTISASGDFGFLGSAVTGSARITMGAMLGPIELYGGYDVMGMAGTENYTGASFHGPIAGVKAHF